MKEHGLLMQKPRWIYSREFYCRNYFPSSEKVWTAVAFLEELLQDVPLFLVFRYCVTLIIYIYLDRFYNWCINETEKKNLIFFSIILFFLILWVNIIIKKERMRVSLLSSPHMMNDLLRQRYKILLKMMMQNLSLEYPMNCI